MTFEYGIGSWARYALTSATWMLAKVTDRGIRKDSLRLYYVIRPYNPETGDYFKSRMCAPESLTPVEPGDVTDPFVHYEEPAMPEVDVFTLNRVDSTGDARTINNVMRHAYRVLSEEEKAQMQAIKDKGLELWTMINALGESRELSIAKTKAEESVMWSVKHLTR